MRITNDHLHSAMLKIISRTFYRRREIINGVWKNEKSTVLSFDCDYDRDMKACLKILKILKTKDVLASFALTGKLVQEFPEVVESILSDSHEIINHTYTHYAEFRKLPPSKKLEEIILFQDLMKDAYGFTVKGFRAPHLRQSGKTDLFDILKRLSLFDSSLIGYGVQDVEGVIEIPLTPFPDIKNMPFCTYHHFRMPLISASQHSFIERWKILLARNNFINVYLDPIDCVSSNTLLSDLITLAFHHEFSFKRLGDISKGIR